MSEAKNFDPNKEPIFSKCCIISETIELSVGIKSVKLSLFLIYGDLNMLKQHQASFEPFPGQMIVMY